MKKGILFCIAIAFFCMLVFLVKNRFKNPQLTVQTAPQSMHFQANTDVIAKDMDEISALMQMLKTNPDDGPLLLKLTEALMRVERWDAAEQFARRAIALEDASFNPHYLLGIILHQRKHMPEAAEELEKALSIKDDGAARYSLAVLYLYFLNEREKGLKHLQKGLLVPDLTPELQKTIKQELEKQTTGQKD